MPTVGSKVPAGICGQQPTLVPCRAHRVPCVVMECQAAVRATNDLRCGSWALLSGQSKGHLELELEQQVENPAVLMLLQSPKPNLSSLCRPGANAP